MSGGLVLDSEGAGIPEKFTTHLGKTGASPEIGKLWR
jgi:hypothetical protein